MEKIDEENELGPTEESNNSQETDEGGDRNNSDSSSDSSEQGNEFYENFSSESSSTVLVSENIQNGDQDSEEIDQEELEREIEKELEEGIEGINKYLEEEAEFINAFQEMVGKARELDEERESEGEGRQMTDEEWEKEVETAAYNAELIYESMKKTEIKPINEEIPENKEDLEKEVEHSKEISEPQLSDLKEDVREQEQELEQIYEGREPPLEHHQVEPFIKEALETVPEPIINEKEIENLQELDIEEQFETVHLNEYVDELVERQDEETEQLKEQVEKEELEAQTSKIKEANSELYEVVEVERDGLDQHEVEATIEEELKTEPEPIINEKEVEKLQELDIEEQFQTVLLNEFIDELVERQDEDKNIENDKIKQEKENIEQTQDVIHQSTYLQKKLEEQELELELKYEEKDVVEQHQVEAAIEEELKTEPKPIINEKELEYIKNLEPEKQLEAELFYEFIEELANKQNEENEECEEKEEHEEISTEEKLTQITRELEIPKEINSGESEVESISQEGELEQETTFLDEEVVEQREIEEYKDHQQELEEILEQNRKIEQGTLKEIELGEEDSEKNIEKNYERAKSLYKQQAGKRPIYANKETKGFKQWLEQKKKSEEKEKTKQKKELKEEQKKEETWKWFLKNWIERATEIDSELKSELKKLVEEYDELEKLVKKYSQLYNKAHRELLSQAEENDLKSLIKTLQKIDPIKIELFLGVREIKRYLNGQHFDDFWDETRVNRIRHHFFTLLSQIYRSSMRNMKKLTREGKDSNSHHRQKIEESTEKEISSEFKVMIEKLIEDNSKYEKLEEKFMEFYKKYKKEEMTKKEKVEFKNNIEKLKIITPLNLKLYAEICGFKAYCKKHLDWNSTQIKNAQSKFIKKLSRKYEKLKFGKQFLKKYAKITSESYKKEILRAFKELGFKPKQIRLSGEFSFKRSDFEDISKFERIVNSRGKYLWYGLVYEITEIKSDKSKGETIAGFTTDSMNTRWTHYVYKALLRHDEGGKLHNLIYNYLNQVGFENLKVNEKYNWRLIFGLLNSRFRRTPVEIHFSSNSLRSGEIDYISEHNLTSSGLNIKAGGGGGSNKMSLPMIKIAYYIALGYMETEIHQKLKNNGIICSKTTIRRRINQFWGSFEEAQIKFLRPVFYLFLKNHFELHEINNAFNRFTLKYIETFFGGRSYKKLKNLVDTENILNLPIIGKLDGWEGKTKLRIPASLLKQLVFQYLKQNEALKDLRVEKYLHEYERSYYRYALQRQIFNQLGFSTWEEARKELVMPLIIKEIKCYESFSSIYHKYGWSKSTAHNHTRVSQRLFFGMNSSQIRQYFDEHFDIETYNDFKKQYLAENG